MVDERCCCGCMHVRTGTFIVVLIEFIFCIVAVVGGIALLSENWNNTNFYNNNWTNQNTTNNNILKYAGIVAVALTVLWFLSLILAIIGLIKYKAVLLLPHLIITAIYLILQTAFIVILIIDQGLAYLFNIIFLIVFIYLWWVEYRCYKWLKETAV